MAPTTRSLHHQSCRLLRSNNNEAYVQTALAPASAKKRRTRRILAMMMVMTTTTTTTVLMSSSSSSFSSSPPLASAFTNSAPAYYPQRMMVPGALLYRSSPSTIFPPPIATTDYRDSLVMEPETATLNGNDDALSAFFTSSSSRTTTRDSEKAAAASNKRPLAFFNKRPTALSQGPSSTPTPSLAEKKSSEGAPKPPRGGCNSENDDDPVCRVVALANSKLPTSPEQLPSLLHESPHDMLRRLDDIYHAMAHDETRLLRYMDTAQNGVSSRSSSREEEAAPAAAYDEAEEQELVAVTRKSLEDAGFELLSRRSLDLCEALNSGYLLRLSIEPDVSQLDPDIFREFYPEQFDPETGKPLNPEDVLFDGRVLVYRRGYSQEVTKGRLLLPKIDYLQASLVQRSAAWIKGKVNDVEEVVSIQTKKAARKSASWYLRRMRSLADSMPNPLLSKAVRSLTTSENSTTPIPSSILDPTTATTPSSFIQLSRYGGSKRRFVGSPDPNDALTPFLICETVQGQKYCPPCPLARQRKLAAINGGAAAAQAADSYYDCDKVFHSGELKCPYDVGTLGPDLSRPAMQQLERVTISNLVNVFSREGRRKLLRTLFSRSELVEPTYEEVVVVWRPLAPKQQNKKMIQPPVIKKPVIAPPKLVYELADMFDIADGLPQQPSSKNGKDKKTKTKKTPPPPEKSPLEIRTFDGVPMANLPAVLPKTKLVFRPADAFVFDLVSVSSLLLLIGSQKFDSTRLDILAVVSVTLWVVRTVFRYSNKLARYDLLVKKFLTSKISHRNAGALKYIATEAGSQRATRAALVHAWLSSKLSSGGTSSTTTTTKTTSRANLVRDGSHEVNQLLLRNNNNNKSGSQQQSEIPINIDAALNDLEDLNLVTCSPSGDDVQVVRNPQWVVANLKRTWDVIFEGRMSLQALMGRRGGGGNNNDSSSSASIGDFM